MRYCRNDTGYVRILHDIEIVIALTSKCLNQCDNTHTFNGERTHQT